METSLKGPEDFTSTGDCKKNSAGSGKNVPVSTPGFLILGYAFFRLEAKKQDSLWEQCAYMQFLQVSHREKKDWDSREKVAAISMCVWGGGGGEVVASKNRFFCTRYSFSMVQYRQTCLCAFREIKIDIRGGRTTLYIHSVSGFE